jgi:hypothetical protein
LTTYRGEDGPWRAGDGNPFSPTLVGGTGYLWGLPLRVRTPMRAVVHVEAPGVAGLTRLARNRCGGERDEARVPRLGNSRIPRLDGSIYRGCWSPP